MELESTVESITSERDAANGRIAELLSGDEDRDSVVSSLTAEKDTLASSLNDAKATIARLETEKGEAEAKLSTTERDDAAAKAETIARSLGRPLGRVIEVQEGGVSVRPMAVSPMRAEMAFDEATPVASGKVGVSASVTIRYALDD